MHGDDKEKGRRDGISHLSENKCQETANWTQAKPRVQRYAGILISGNWYMFGN